MRHELGLCPCRRWHSTAFSKSGSAEINGICTSLAGSCAALRHAARGGAPSTGNNLGKALAAPMEFRRPPGRATQRQRCRASGRPAARPSPRRSSDGPHCPCVPAGCRSHTESLACLRGPAPGPAAGARLRRELVSHNSAFYLELCGIAPMAAGSPGTTLSGFSALGCEPIQGMPILGDANDHDRGSR